MQRNIVRTAEAPAAIGPYSQAVVVPVGDGRKMVFCSGQIALDPVTGAMTRGGRWVHGLLVGALTAIVRALNPAHPEGTMMAVLLGGVLAPLVDQAVVRLRLARRRRRLG